MGGPSLFLLLLFLIINEYLNSNDAKEMSSASEPVNMKHFLSGIFCCGVKEIRSIFCTSWEDKLFLELFFFVKTELNLDVHLNIFKSPEMLCDKLLLAHTTTLNLW